METSRTPPADPRAFTHRPLFWTLLTLVALAGVVFAVRYFPEAFPIAGVELEMDREGALEGARELAELNGWGPEGFRQATTFGDETPMVRVYVELEHGEENSIRRLEEEGGYHPYQWRVRHFLEGETREVTVRFTPAGRPLGFRLRLPEDEPGAALGPDDARALAEEQARTNWRVSLARYELVESSQEVRPSGRVDHTFVYLLRDAGIGDADFRLRLGVAGDRLSEVREFVRVPQAFQLRYQEMRAANVNVAIVASILFLVLFLLVGCGLGIFHLVRTRWLEWRRPLAWGAVVAGLMALSTLNTLPLAWFGYDTAVSSTLFLVQQVLGAAGLLILGTALLAVVFMTAESLDRKAFPHRPQQWRLWHPEVARSGPAVGRTVGGYLVAAAEVGFVVAFYLWAMRREGWWMPSEALVQPDLLATYAPWLTAVATALFAGFWEESLFRAVPIAGAALIGARFGRPGLWIGAALILQAVLFAAAHADYPQQPAYARVTELLFPALLWGLIYLWFGLVPVIIAHAGYNLSLMSLPLWVSSAPGIWLDRTAVVVIGLIPLWIVLYHVVRRGYAREAPGWAWNRAWKPPEPSAEEPASPQAATAPDPGHEAGPSGVPEPDDAQPWADEPEAWAHARAEDGPQGADPQGVPRIRGLLAGTGVAGLLLWAAGTLALPQPVSLEVTRTQAEDLARDALVQEGLGPLDEEWRAFPGVRGGLGESHRFVWEEGGEVAFRTLLGSYLREPSWTVRFARFTGPVEERAEEFHVGLGPQGQVFRIRQQLPEGREGASLDEDEARTTATLGLASRFGLEAEELQEISADATNRPARQDWSFTWSHDQAWPLERGEARVRISLAGDRVTDGVQFVHTPEEWDRERSGQRTREQVLGLSSGFLLLLLLGAAAVAGLVRWARGRFALGDAVTGGGILVAALLLSMLNSLPSVTEGFATVESFETQLWITLTALTVVAVVSGAALGLVTGFVHAWRRDAPEAGSGPVPRTGSPPDPVLMGGVLGVLAAGVHQVWTAFGPRALPPWPSYSPAGAWLPLVDPALEAPMNVAIGGLFLLLVLVATDRVTDRWTRSRLLGATGLVLAAAVAPVHGVGQGIGVWLVGVGVVAMGLYVLVRISLRFGVAWVPMLTATGVALGALDQAIHQAWTGAPGAYALAAAVALILGWGWSRRLEPPPRQ